jgi:restriction endonuclease S subunit
VTVSDIRDWQISGEVKPLGEMNSRYNRYIIDNDDIVIGKVPAPFKEAVAQIPEGKIYVASVNCYILKVDKSKCDPYYLMAFLCSKLGQEQISRILTGVTLRTITIEGLEKIQVPMVSLEKQKIFAEAFKKKINFTHISRLQVEKAVQDTEGAFDTFMKEEEKC